MSKSTAGLSLLLVFATTAARGDELILKSGLVLQGSTRQSKTITSDQALQGNGNSGSYKLVDQRYKYYFIPNRLVESQQQSDTFRSESFKLRHKVTSLRRMPDWIGAFSSETPFDEFGVRTVTIETPAGPQQVIQAITRITPEYVWIKSLTHRWEYGMATTSLPPEVLDEILRRAIRPDDEHDRLAACRFLIEARQYALADQWLTEVEAEFPGLNKQVAAVKVNLRHAYARRLLTELEQRKAAGQHTLVQASLSQFPRTDLPSAVLDAVEHLRLEYSAGQQAIDKILSQLKSLESGLEKKLAAGIEPLRNEVQQQLNFASFDRLQAYITLSADKTLTPEERLAVAYSGWMLGSANASTNLPETLGLAAGRKFVSDYLQSPDALDRRRAVDELGRLEGVTPRSLVRLLAASPPGRDPNARAGRTETLTVPLPDGGTAEYKAVLPPEYSPWHSYPMIVALHQANLTPDHALNWWAGTSNAPLQAPRRGYIVIAPDYIPPGTTEYISNPQSHRVVLAAIRDALRRFSVDSDRVFLSGHGSGGEATLDIGMAHADLFAGAIPIVAIAGPACDRLYKNCSDLPWYVILGERHRDSLAENSAVLDRLARVNPDVTICVYRDRGFESYYEEIHNLFDWMENHARGPMPAQFEVVTVRPEDRSFFWLEADGFPDFLQNQNFRRGPGFRPVKSVEFNLRVTPANSVDIIRAGANDLTLRLMDGVVDFDKPIRIGMRRRGRIDPAPSIADVLDDFSRYRDGSRIALQRVAL